MVADGTVTPLIRGAKLEGAGEEHSEAVAAELAAALEEKVRTDWLSGLRHRIRDNLLRYEDQSRAQQGDCSGAGGGAGREGATS